MSDKILISRAVNIIVDEKHDLGEIIATVSPGGIVPIRKEVKGAGAYFKRNPITGFNFELLKLKVSAFPEGIDELPCHIPLTISFYEHFVSETDQSEIGHRHFWQCELEKAPEPERKSEEIPEWEYVGQNPRIYRRFTDGVLKDQGSTSSKIPLVLNGKTIWEKRSRLLGRG